MSLIIYILNKYPEYLKTLVNELAYGKGMNVRFNWWFIIKLYERTEDKTCDSLGNNKL